MAADTTGWLRHAHDTLGSTNAEALRLAAEGAPDRTLVTARQQSAGRGRLGRSWSSPAGNLYASFLLRPKVPASRTAEIGFVAALAVMDAADALIGPRVRLKWPNDVLLDGAKLAGILTEMAADAVVVGIGVNVASAPAGLPYPTACLGGPATADSVLHAVASALSQRLAAWTAGGFGDIRLAWMERGPIAGAALSVQLGPAPTLGAYAGLDPGGALLLDTAGGRRRIVAGDVTDAGATGMAWPDDTAARGSAAINPVR